MAPEVSFCVIFVSLFLNFNHSESDSDQIYASKDATNQGFCIN